MYGFGDGPNPRQETVDLVEARDLLSQISSESEWTGHGDRVHFGAVGTSSGHGYIQGQAQIRGLRLASLRGRQDCNRLTLMDVKEPAKLERLKEVLEKNEEIKKARKVRRQAW